MKFFLLGIALGSLCLFSHAVEATNTPWTPGVIFYENGDTLHGDMVFQMHKHEIWFRNKDIVRVYHCSELKRFIFYDRKLDMMRSFANYPYKKNAVKKVLLEQVVLGQYHFLKEVCYKIKGGKDEIGIEYYDKINTYYFWDRKQLIKVKNFKKQFSELFASNGIDMAELAEEFHYYTYLPQDQIKMVRRLNMKVAKELRMEMVYQE